jgi:hypothetical protein
VFILNIEVTSEGRLHGAIGDCQFFRLAPFIEIRWGHNKVLAIVEDQF